MKRVLIIIAAAAFGPWPFVFRLTFSSGTG